MSAVRNYVDASLAIFRRDVLVYLSYRSRIVTQNIGVIFTLTLYYYLSKLIAVPAFPDPSDYFAFVVIGIVVVSVLHASFEVPNIVRQELLTGTFERLVVSAFGPLGSVLSLIFFPLMLALLVSTFTLTLAAVIFGLSVTWTTVPFAIPVALLGAMSFSGFALIFAAIMLRFKQVPGSAYLLAAISIVAGMYFPVTVLPEWIQWASEVQPFTSAIDLLRNLIVGFPLESSVASELVKLVGFTVLLVPFGIFVLTLSIRASRASGTITEF